MCFGGQKIHLHRGLDLVCGIAIWFYSMMFWKESLLQKQANAITQNGVDGPKHQASKRPSQMDGDGASKVPGFEVHQKLQAVGEKLKKKGEVVL